MQVDEAEKRLRTLLRASNLDLDRLDSPETWKVFKVFAAESVEGLGREPESDMCLFQCGVYDWSDGKGRRFNWNLTRQFVIDADGEYDHMEQLSCDLYFEVTPELEALKCDGIWSGSDLVGWAAEVEAQEAFHAVAELTPVESSVTQFQV